MPGKRAARASCELPGDPGSRCRYPSIRQRRSSPGKLCIGTTDDGPRASSIVMYLTLRHATIRDKEEETKSRRGHVPTGKPIGKEAYDEKTHVSRDGHNPAAAFALPLNAAPMFAPKPEQVRADVVETVKQWKKRNGNRHWRNGRHLNNRYAWRNGRHWNNRYATRNCRY